MPPVPASDWLSQGGTYTILGGAWLLSAILWAGYAFRLGKLTSRQNDGCLLAISNFIMALLGGGAGLLIANKTYPMFIFSSVAGTIILPMVSSFVFLRKPR